MLHVWLHVWHVTFHSLETTANNSPFSVLHSTRWYAPTLLTLTLLYLVYSKFLHPVFNASFLCCLLMLCIDVKIKCKHLLHIMYFLLPLKLLLKPCLSQSLFLHLDDLLSLKDLPSNTILKHCTRLFALWVHLIFFKQKMYLLSMRLGHN